jgi:hypothetical protein
MNWGAIGTGGEILGAVAVVIVLFYLSMQLRPELEAGRT